MVKNTDAGVIIRDSSSGHLLTLWLHPNKEYNASTSQDWWEGYNIVCIFKSIIYNPGVILSA